MRKYVRVVGNVILVCESKHGMGLKDLNVMIKEGMNLGWVLDLLEYLACTTLVNT
jgi:hypothetical protein